jgi:hypothetical protein
MAMPLGTERLEEMKMSSSLMRKSVGFVSECMYDRKLCAFKLLLSASLGTTFLLVWVRKNTFLFPLHMRGQRRN